MTTTDLEAANQTYAERTCRKRMERGWKEGVIEKAVRGKGGAIKVKVLWDQTRPTYEDPIDLHIY